MDPNNSDGLGWPNNLMNPFYHQGQGFGYEYQDPGYLPYDEGNQDGDGEEDFYMDDDPEEPLEPKIETSQNSLPATGASTPKPEPVRRASTPTAKTQTKDIEAESKLAALRARLIATRTSTPGRDHRAESPLKEKVLEAPKVEQRPTTVRVAGDEQRSTTSGIQTAVSKNNVQKAVVADTIRAQPDMPADSERSKRTTGIDELLREGQAAAEATAKEQNMQDLRKSSSPTIAGASEQWEPKKQPIQANKRPVAQLPYKSSESSELGEIREKPAKASSQALSRKVDVPQQAGARASTSESRLSHPQLFERKDVIANNKTSNGRAQRMGSPSKQNNQIKEPEQTVYKEREEREVKSVASNSKPPASNIQDRAKGQLTQSQDQVSQGGRPIRQPADAQRSNSDTYRTEPRQQPIESQEQGEMPHQRARPKPANVQEQNQKSHCVENQQSPGDAKALAIRKPVQSSSHSTALQSKHFNDLDEWLEATNYHDEAYRHRVIQRHKARKELEIQRAKLEQEEEEDKVYLARSLTMRSSEGFRSSSVTAMPPPPVPTTVTAGAVQSPVSTRIDDTSNDVHTLAVVASKANKRVHSPSTSPVHGQEPTVKLARVNSGGRDHDRSQGRPALKQRYHDEDRTRGSDDRSGYRIRGADDGKFAHSHSSRTLQERTASPVPLERRISLPTSRSREISPSRRSVTEYTHEREAPYGWDDRHGQYDERRVSSNYRGRGRGRASYSSTNTRGGKYYTNQRNLSRDEHTDVHGLELHKGGVRYFMIKSFNYDNVEASQRDGIWATQERNAAVLTEAFNTCRHVILCFSVNKSMGFQGYARMKSPPGSAPTPTFVEKLFWSPSPPFYIRWLTVAETHFRKVGHLKNAYNENQAVLVGKDGQEIEEGCGMGLCELIDEEAERWLSGGF